MAGSATTREIHSNYFENASSHLHSTPVPGLPPVGSVFASGATNLSADAEPSVPVHANDPAGPADGWMLADSLLVFDQVKRQLMLWPMAILSDGTGRAAYASAEARDPQPGAERMQAPLPKGVKTPALGTPSPTSRWPHQQTASQADYEAAGGGGPVHIAAVTCSKLVNSQRLETPIQRDPFETLPQPADGESLPVHGFSTSRLVSDRFKPEVMVKAEPTAGVLALRFGHCRNRPGQSEARNQRLGGRSCLRPQGKGRACDAGRSWAATIWGRVCRPAASAVTD